MCMNRETNAELIDVCYNGKYKKGSNNISYVFIFIHEEKPKHFDLLVNFLLAFCLHFLKLQPITHKIKDRITRKKADEL